MNYAVLIDDENNDVMAVVQTNCSKGQILDAIKEVKESKPGEWSNTDIIEAINGIEIDVKYFYV